MIKKIIMTINASLIIVGLAGAEDNRKTRKAGYDNDPGLVGPGSTTAQLEEDDEVKSAVMRIPALDSSLEPWFKSKARLQEQFGLQLGLAYTALYQASSDAPDGAEDEAGSGIARLSGKWSLFDRGGAHEGALVFSLDHRHRYTDIAPQDLGFSSGYLGIPGVLFSNEDGVVGDVYWAQKFNGGNSSLILGRYDPNEFFDVLGYANPWSTFQNAAILFNASIALPEKSTGIGVGHWFDDQWYGKAAVNDVNGTISDVQFFEDFDELYTTAEVGWSPTREERHFKNVHVTAWRADDREDAGIEESEGVTLGANWTVDDTWMAFFKAGWSDGSAPLYNESATIGAIHYYAERSDLSGIAINWGGPADNSLDDQWTGELFYRLQLAQNLALTPSVQLIIDPANNPAVDELWIGSLRARVTF